MRRSFGVILFASLAMSLAACPGRDGARGVDGSAARDGGVVVDGSRVRDGGGGADDGALGPDARVPDEDGGVHGEGGVGRRDGGGGGSDGAVASDGGAGMRDAGARDAGAIDAGPMDAGGRDAGPAADAGHDAGLGDCISGATGTHAVRFRWAGSGPSSTAYVRYDVNQLPDTSRWRVTAASSSIGYRPVFDDTFLGAGGLDLEGTAFIDVELSTSGLSSIRNVSLAILGRSFNTTASGSFQWQTFDGTGAAPSGLVWNSAPYQWYRADATTEFSPGDSGVLLRIRAGPPSGALIVNSVEICFDAR